MPLKTAKCGKCKELKDYPLVKVPLGPAKFEDVDGKAAQAGLDVKNGFVMYSSFCLPCAQQYLDGINEEYLRGEVT